MGSVIIKGHTVPVVIDGTINDRARYPRRTYLHQKRIVFSRMAIENGRKALARIALFPDTYHQPSWGQHNLDAPRGDKPKFLCGTSACFAGHLMLIVRPPRAERQLTDRYFDAHAQTRAFIALGVRPTGAADSQLRAEINLYLFYGGLSSNPEDAAARFERVVTYGR